jgi:membrane protein DedA with SNARE-associated domain/rhodanese-related sulfurtransferase
MQQIIELVHQYGVLAVCLSALLEDSGLPFPSYPVLMIAGALMLGGDAAPLVLVAAVAAGLVADIAWYFAGSLLGRRVLRFVCRMSFSPGSCVRHTEAGFARVGPWVLLFVKFIPGIALATIVLSGVTRLRLARFLLFDAIGATIYFGLAYVLGRVFHDAITSILAAFARLGEIGAAIIIGLLALYVLVRVIRGRILDAELRRSRISAGELANLIENGKRPLILDIRESDLRHRQGVIPGALAVMASQVAVLSGVYPLETSIIVYSSQESAAPPRVAARYLKKAGFQQIRPLEGGIEAWAKAGYPTERSDDPVSASPRRPIRAI